MNTKRLILEDPFLSIVIQRMCHEIIENHGDFEESVILGLQPRGVYFAEKITDQLAEIRGIRPKLGYLDATFFRDDFKRRDSPLKPNATQVPFLIENKKVILIDDVMQTGRMVRAALDAMTAFGRPKLVELCVLVSRKYENQLPIKADYMGVEVNTVATQKVQVEWKAQGAPNDNIWLVEA